MKIANRYGPNGAPLTQLARPKPKKASAIEPTIGHFDGCGTK
jgi:hypothetical protein